MRALVSNPRSPTITTRCSLKRCFSLSICADNVAGSAVFPGIPRHRHRAALGGTHQADDNLRPVAAVVAAVAILRQFAASSFEIGRGDVVEQQRAIFQVTAGQRGFDERLLASQPVERGIHLLGGDLAEPQDLAQRMAGGGGIQHPRGRQLGRRLEQARDNQGQRQIAPALRRAARQHRVERDAACGAQRGEHMAVRQRADDFHRRSGGQQLVAAQHRAELLNALGRPAGQVGEGSVPGLARLTVALAQENGRRRASVRDNSHIHALLEPLLDPSVNHKLLYYMTAKKANITSFQQLHSQQGQSSG